jgi:hypothetical protein
MKYNSLMSAILMLTGCATTGSSTSADLDAIKIGRTAQQDCRRMADLSFTCQSRNMLVTALKRKASERGANFVKVTSLRVGEVTGRVKVSGVAMYCAQTEPKEVELMPLIDEEPAKIMTKAAMVTKPKKQRTLVLSTVPDDDNPFE